MRVTLTAPEEVNPVRIAQALLEPGWLLKAKTQRLGNDSFFRWPALGELQQTEVDLYRAQSRRMLASIRARVNEFVGTHLFKAMPLIVPLLTPQQLELLANVVRDFHTGFAVQIGAVSDITQAEVERLVEMGALPRQILDSLQDSYTYGRLVGSLREFDAAHRAKQFSLSDFREHLKRHPVKLSQQDRAAIDWAKHSAAVHIKGLGNEIADDLSTTIVNADAELRRRYASEIRTDTQANLERHESWRRLASDFGHRSEDWARDFGRIAATEKQNAMQEGFAISLIEREGDPDLVRVAKLPQPSACKDCIRLHLTAGPGSPPRIFTLESLRANGTNVKKKRTDWAAVIGTVHPWCQCELVHVPPGWGFKGQDLVPEPHEKSFSYDLSKALRYTNAPESGCIVRISDPQILQEVQAVIDRTPASLFTSKTGVTFVTTDISRPESELSPTDLAYWTGNEIRISQTLPPEKVQAVLEHEFGHAPNVYLIHKLGGEAPVRAWHQELYAISLQEGFVSKYAISHPIENAAELTRLYLYNRDVLLRFPRQFAFLRRAYKELF
jgi:hypothetical protein